MTKYNVHKNWDHWNVSLWINSDESLYRLAVQCVNTAKTKDQAAKEMLEYLPEVTPDGAAYSFSAVRAAMVGM